MRTRAWRTAILLCATAAAATAQKAKSQKELDAVIAVQNATTPDARIAAVEALITKFADTEFKGIVLFMAADAAHQKGDSPKTVFYAERAIEANPKDFNSMLLLSGEIAMHTREFDLDRDEKLAKADKLAKTAMGLIPTAAKPNPQITDAQWEAAKKDMISQAHEDLGLAATVRKNYDGAVAEFKIAVDEASDPEPGTMVRLASAYSDAGKPDLAIGVLNRAAATPNLSPVVKRFVDSEMARAQKLKSGQK